MMMRRLGCARLVYYVELESSEADATVQGLPGVMSS